MVAGRGIAALLGWPLFAFVAAAIALLTWDARAELAVPELSSRVVDEAGLLTEANAQALEQRLAAYGQKTGHQFALVTVPSLQGGSIEDFSLRVAEKWKLGDAARDDGLLLVVAKDDRKVRIEVGYGLEGAVPDAVAARVIREAITPSFRKGDYAGGISEAFKLLMAAAEGESLGPPQQPEGDAGGSASRFLPLLLIAFLLVPMLGRGRRRGSGHRSWGRRGFFVGGMGGGFGGGGGGGGGFSGGGGGFGGGGASGGW